MTGPSPNPVFRASFLARLKTPEAVEAVAGFGAVLKTLLDEANWWCLLDDDRPDDAAEVQTAAADLEAVVRQLEDLASRREKRELPANERAVCEAAAAWAGELARIALRMHRAAEERSAAEEDRS